MHKIALKSQTLYPIYLEDNIEACIQRKPSVLFQAIQRACEIKATIVKSEAKETI